MSQRRGQLPAADVFHVGDLVRVLPLNPACPGSEWPPSRPKSRRRRHPHLTDYVDTLAAVVQVLPELDHPYAVNPQEFRLSALFSAEELELVERNGAVFVDAEGKEIPVQTDQGERDDPCLA